jgi:EAL domain-containing protein (putative c-di-GMP-specific phosphodiesterase class I)
VKKIINAEKIKPDFLNFEVTESVLIEDVDKAANVLCDLHDLGIKLSIDDFGTGYSSLNYLKRFPVNIIKIDRSFVKDIITDKSNAVITQAIISICRNLDMQVVAEGVETIEQYEYLNDLQCDYIQGYYYSPPLSVEDATKLMRYQFQTHT